jgi:DUF4097 and DUF4098 domain-containing protein YvlB
MKQKSIYRTLFLTILFCMAVDAQQLIQKGDYWSWKDEKTFPVFPGGLLKMQGIRGDVSVQPWEKAEVKIEVVHHIEVLTEDEARALAQKIETRYEKNENTILIEGSNVHKKSMASDYDIWVPRKFNCDISIEGGDLVLEGIEGKADVEIGGGDSQISNIAGPLVLSTGGGDVSIEGCTKDVNIELGGGDLSVSMVKEAVKIQSGGGDIEIEACEGPVSVELGGGDVEIRKITKDVTCKLGGGEASISSIGGFVNCEVGGGSIEVMDAAGAITAKTGAGEIEVKITGAERPESASVFIETGMGDLEITLPASIKATIDAVNFRFYGDSDEEIDSDFPLKITKSEGFGDKSIQASGDINGGGAKISLRAHGGSITIRKNSAP